MAVTVGEIAALMEEWAPARLAEDWDNVGLLVGDSGRNVEKALVALDAVNAVIDEAITKSCQMIITHHPLFRVGLKKLNDSDHTAKKIMRLMENKIALFSAHTNLDKADGGVNDVLCQILGLNFSVKKDANGDNGLIRTAALEKPQTLGELAGRYADVLKTPYLPVVGDLDREITRVAVVSGNGMSVLKEAAESGAELFISGDIRYHDANDALDYGMAMLDLTHYASETVVAGAAKKYLDEKKREKGLVFEVIVSETDAQPFTLAGNRK